MISPTVNESGTVLGTIAIDNATTPGNKQPTMSLLASDFDKESQFLVARSILNFKAKSVKSKRLKLTDDEPDEKLNGQNQAQKLGVISL